MSGKKGLIVKGIAGFYYVKSGDEVYRCKARGVFKQRAVKPAVGDEVEFEVIPENDDSLITGVLPRRNCFIRPFIANVDCFAIVTAAASPAPILSVIDKFMVMAEKNGTEIILCVNKCDLAEGDREAAKKAQENIATLQRIYGSVYPVLLMDPDREESLAEFRRMTLGEKGGAGRSFRCRKIDDTKQAYSSRAS